jgi:hypothetical protein
MLMVATGVIPERDCGRGCRDPNIRRMWGCDGDTSEFPLEVERDDGSVETIRRCPYALARESGAWAVLRRWNHYRRGFLPFEGGTEDQPRKLMEAIEFVDAHIEEYHKRAEDPDDGTSDSG